MCVCVCAVLAKKMDLILFQNVFYLFSPMNSSFFISSRLNKNETKYLMYLG